MLHTCTLAVSLGAWSTYTVSCACETFHEIVANCCSAGRSPVGPNGLLTTNVPYVQLETLMVEAFDVEALHK